ncbi:MAG: flagellar export chaperone FliS [Candidatus Dactylopiibacterium carminicum]|uniref:Flagellar secretion chaperone FliS n=1 Tax=Candidatus Dactylopiibacterium carminicum TaxID=857335 RepID=A0A272EWG4_9RHOO|nr:flagellar export chaperone FliS [Candidatus Dactylopiibacterium carminicum]KAF7599967.1 flagellar export chaperone FliS [Candidatus Dactylopiibacterium carminicum]PAS94452.1 MAG: flagellar export chaperone FliS [Candidatus Dactylopiibacterium carminicum]PAS97063.1 MAG: flagellar export chaperone FliS [Candidatus Dactylopiibacterium carminicum]PAS99970.1 MAG: flagellar export chaperone FliS [Candidatus Dactylopiibacterium carminicum]
MTTLAYDAYQSYQTVNVDAQTAQASPVQLVLLLMDGLLDELARARAHIEARRFELKARSLERAIGMLNGLSSALDMDAGGEVVANLERLYAFCAEHLHQAGVALDPGKIDEVVAILQTLREGWQSVQAKNG